MTITCPSCHQQVDDAEAYCPNCRMSLSSAAALVDDATQPRAELHPPSPETSSAWQPCPVCGANNVPGSLFCDTCGERLALPLASAVSFHAAPSAANTLACPTCGANNAPGSAFCESCGEHLAALSAQTPANTADETVSAVLSSPAAEQLSRAKGVCPTCGEVNLPDSAFCENCGEPLQPGVAPPPVPTLPAVSVEIPSPSRPVLSLTGECPTCGMVNSPDSAFCENCGEPLRAATMPAPASIPPRQICPACGAANLPGEMYCEACGTQLPPVMVTPPPPPIPLHATDTLPAAGEVPPTRPLPSPAVSKGAAVCGRLVVQSTQSEIVLPPGKKEIVLGRVDPVRSIFPDVDTTPHGGVNAGVSRRHARLVVQGGKVFIEDLGSTNFTYLNQQKLKPGRPARLSDGDVIRLGWLAIVYRAS